MYVATVITIACAARLTIAGYQKIWALFGACNQLVSVPAFLAVSCWLNRIGKNNRMFYFPCLLYTSKKDENSGDCVCFCGYQLIAMSGSSKHKDEAWLFMEHMMSNDVVWDRTETFNTPIVKKSLEDKYMESGDKELKSAILNYVENGKGKATVP